LLEIVKFLGQQRLQLLHDEVVLVVQRLLEDLPVGRDGVDQELK
jgi:hypothetical protein